MCQVPAAHGTAMPSSGGAAVQACREAAASRPLLTTGKTRDLSDLVAPRRKNLTAAYLIRGHSDHRLGSSLILDRFPDARDVAVPAVIEHPAGAVHPGGPRLPLERVVPGRLALADPLPGLNPAALRTSAQAVSSS